MRKFHVVCLLSMTLVGCTQVVPIEANRSLWEEPLHVGTYQHAQSGKKLSFRLCQTASRLSRQLRTSCFFFNWGLGLVKGAQYFSRLRVMLVPAVL